MTENEAIEENCECRSENGNCLVIGGFCTSVPKEYCSMAIELQQYRSIGTVQECREAREKQKEKKPKHSGCYDNERVWHEWNGIDGKPYELCSNCGTNLCCEMPYDKKPKYCNECGQKLDWS